MSLPYVKGIFSHTSEFFLFGAESTQNLLFSGMFFYDELFWWTSSFCDWVSGEVNMLPISWYWIFFRISWISWISFSKYTAENNVPLVLTKSFSQNVSDLILKILLPLVIGKLFMFLMWFEFFILFQKNSDPIFW